MKIGIFYFSGTGNTKYIADSFATYFLQFNHAVTVSSIEKITSIQEYDLIAIGGPIYAGNVPEKLIKWVLRNIPNTSHAKAIVFSSSAGLQNAKGANSLAVKLSKKGYKILGLLKYALPRNYYFENYQQPTKDEIQNLFDEVDKNIPKDLSNILALEGESYQEKVLGIDLLAETMSVMTRFMGKSFSVSESCNQCKKCVHSCPTNNIVLKDKISFKLHCMMCTRCVHSCPRNAIMYKKNSVVQYQIV